jgi:Leucine-rich repeat (LRR) protein
MLRLLATQVASSRVFMQELPPSIGRCKALASLSLAHNHLRSLPPEIAFCSALAELSVRDNALVDIGPGVPRLPALRLLDVCNNELSSLPPALGFSTTLRAVPLTGNPMRSIPRQIRDGMPHILSPSDFSCPLLSFLFSQALLLTTVTGNSILSACPACSCKPIPCTLTC